VRRTLLTASLVVVSLAGGTAKAGPVSARGDVWVYSSSATSATLCAEGVVDDGAYLGPGEWRFVVRGVRSNGSRIEPGVAARSGAVFPRTCVAVSRAGQAYVAVTAHLTYVGGGTEDVMTLAGLVGRWDSAPGFTDASYGTSRSTGI
jgi:hypothetical protein